MAHFLDAHDPDFAQNWDKFIQAPRGSTSADVMQASAKIVEHVRTHGAEAVAQYTQEFDRLSIDPSSLQAPSIQLEALAAQCPAPVCAALDFAAKRIRDFHMHQKPQNHLYQDPEGLELGWRWNALDSAALYVPGGRASYPSSVLMNAIPAQIAGVRRIVMVAPAPDGHLNPAVAYAALSVGIQEFYPLGGAQAIAALTFGAGQLTPVAKIVGPGNAYVAAAKRIVFGHVGIDSVAGPSEVCIVADADNDPQWIAADLLAQAEHDPDAQSVLMTPDGEFAKAVNQALETMLAELPTQAIAAPSWKNHGAIIRVSLEQAPKLIDQLAPEHLQIALDDPDTIANAVRYAGAIFLGKHAPEVLGDYVSGPNHVLPTSRTARFSSGLSVPDFCTRTSLQRVSNAACQTLSQHACVLAEAEGLAAHALSARLRLEPKP